MTIKSGGTNPFPQPNNPAGYGKWYGKVTIPKDGDPNNEVTFLGITDLTERTNWLAWRILDIRNGGVYANAVVQFNGPIVFGNSTYPLLEPARSWERHGLELMGVTHTQAADPDDLTLTFLPDAWVDFTSGEPVIDNRPMGSSAGKVWLRLRDLPDGATLTSVTISTIGLAISAPITKATFRLGRRKGRAAISWVAAAVSDTHSDGNYITTELDTTVFSGSHTIDKDYVYFVEVTLPYKASPSGPMRIYNVKAAGTAARLGL